VSSSRRGRKRQRSGHILRETYVEGGRWWCRQVRRGGGAGVRAEVRG